MKIVYVLLYCIMFSVVKGQNGPAGVSGALLWYMSEIESIQNHTTGSWFDATGQNKTLKIVQWDEEEYPDTYTDSVFSVNYNPALKFSERFKYHTLTIPENISNGQVTVIGVLIPRKKDIVDEEWVLYEDGNTIISSLTLTSFSSSNYNIEYNPNLIKGGKGSEEYGKIVTTQMFIGGSLCYELQAFKDRLLNVYSDPLIYGNASAEQQNGFIAEFMVFDHLLDENERFQVESYLALKYGINKRFDYVSPSGTTVWDYEKAQDESNPDENYLCRVTGIGCDGMSLDQGKSTTYYDETGDGRSVGFELDEDYSHHRNRLLAISNADESQSICTRWGANDYFIWGDNDVDLEMSSIEKYSGDSKWSEEPYDFISRVWMGQENIEVESEPVISMVNFDNTIRIPSGTWRNYFRKRYTGVGNQERIGILASSSSSKDGTLARYRWRLRRSGSGRTMIGLSLNNSIFPGSSEEDFQNFVYAVYFRNGHYYLVVDEDMDGEYDVERDLGNIGNLRTIYYVDVARVSGGYRFRLHRQGQGIKDSRIIEFPSSTGFFMKGVLYDDVQSFQTLGGTRGFNLESPSAMNVELSIERIEEICPGFIESGQEMNLLIDRSGTGRFRYDDTDIIPGSVSVTPGGFYDKIEFSNVDFSGDIDNCTHFTFGKSECGGLEIANLDVGPVGCCGDSIQMTFDLIGCLGSGKYFYSLTHIESGVVYQGEIELEENLYLCPLPQGTYHLLIQDLITYQLQEFSLNALFNSGDPFLNNNSVIWPSTPFEEPCEMLTDGLLNLDVGLHFQTLEQTYGVVNYGWYRDGIKLTDGSSIQIEESGIYELVVKVTCPVDDCDIQEVICTRSYLFTVCEEERPICEIQIDIDCDQFSFGVTSGTTIECEYEYLISDGNGNTLDGTGLVNLSNFSTSLPNGNYTLVVTYIDDCCEGKSTVDFNIDCPVEENCYIDMDYNCSHQTASFCLHSTPESDPCPYSYNILGPNGFEINGEGVLDGIDCASFSFGGYGSGSYIISIKFESGDCCVESLIDTLIIQCCTDLNTNFPECIPIKGDGQSVIIDLEDIVGTYVNCFDFYWSHSSLPFPNAVGSSNRIELDLLEYLCECIGIIGIPNNNIQCPDLCQIDVCIQIGCEECKGPEVDCSGCENPPPINMRNGLSLRSHEDRVSNIASITYTNPISSNRLYQFKILFDYETEVTMEVYSQGGRKISESRVASSKSYVFDVELPLGVYFLRFSGSDYQEVLKIIVL